MNNVFDDHRTYILLYAAITKHTSSVHKNPVRLQSEYLICVIESRQITREIGELHWNRAKSEYEVQVPSIQKI